MRSQTTTVNPPVVIRTPGSPSRSGHQPAPSHYGDSGRVYRSASALASSAPSDARGDDSSDLNDTLPCIWHATRSYHAYASHRAETIRRRRQSHLVSDILCNSLMFYPRLSTTTRQGVKTNQATCITMQFPELLSFAHCYRQTHSTNTRITLDSSSASSSLSSSSSIIHHRKSVPPLFFCSKLWEEVFHNCYGTKSFEADEGKNG